MKENKKMKVVQNDSTVTAQAVIVSTEKLGISLPCAMHNANI